MLTMDTLNRLSKLKPTDEKGFRELMGEIKEGKPTFRIFFDELDIDLV